VAERQDWPVVRAAERIAWSRCRVDALRTEVARWFAARRPDERFTRFAKHFDVLDTIIGHLLDAIDSGLVEVVHQADSPGLVHERCRGLDTGLNLVRRLHLWYSAKYDQRLDDRLSPTLRAADEVIRSCWTEPFSALRRTPPTGPLVYLDPRFDATATPRVSVPPDLRAPEDAVVGDLVRELPVPVVALPAISVDEPWWLVLGAHETGHHVQTDLVPGLVRDTRTALLAATAGSAHWHGWAQEAFADAFSVLMVGSAATWAVDELQYGRPSRLAREPRPGDRYPPPAVRTALLGELARLAGVPDHGLGVDDVREWLARVPEAELPAAARSAVSEQLDVTAAAARALVELPVDGKRLRDLCGYDPSLFGSGGRAGRWARALVTAAPVIAGRAERPAARIGIAGGVAAYRADPSRADVLRINLPDQLSRCGPSGHLAAPPTADLDEVAERLTGRLIAATRDEVRG
jgi:hypothetical protein